MHVRADPSISPTLKLGGGTPPLLGKQKTLILTYLSRPWTPRNGRLPTQKQERNAHADAQLFFDACCRQHICQLSDALPQAITGPSEHRNKLQQTPPLQRLDAGPRRKLLIILSSKLLDIHGASCCDVLCKSVSHCSGQLSSFQESAQVCHGRVGAIFTNSLPCRGHLQHSLGSIKATQPATIHLAR